ncbi:MAG TPA: hypothetical protein VFU06_10395 [Longimicrobiales bacterium]|nr:hypothetical protein [Longimicrobiales bacterium]
MTKRFDDHVWRRDLGRAVIVSAALLVGCGGGSSSTEPPPPPPAPPPADERVLPDTIDVGELLEQVKADMPRRDSDDYRPPTPDQRIAMVGILEDARAGRIVRADSLAELYGYNVEAAVEAGHGDSVVVMIERAPIQRGWGTYIVRKGARAADVHVNHPLFDTNTPAVAAELYDACRCRALLMAGTHRYANGGDESDMARATGSVFQGVHEVLAVDAEMVVSVHGFARDNYDEPIGSADAVLSLGADAQGALAANDDARALRDSLRNAGFVAGLIADDADYTQLTGSPNPQGRHSNAEFGHGRWIHIELAREVRTEQDAYELLTGLVAAWLADVVS